MKIIEKRLDDIRPYERNPRDNSSAVDKVAASISEFGFKQPIVIDADGVIIAGHTRYKAAEKLKLETVPVVIAADLTPEQVKAYRLADNKTAEFSTWDAGILDDELFDIMEIDMEQFGFDLSEFGEEPEAQDDEYDFDNEEADQRVQRGQIWLRCWTASRKQTESQRTSKATRSERTNCMKCCSRHSRRSASAARKIVLTMCPLRRVERSA